MRSTSSRRSAVALLLCAALLSQGVPGGIAHAAETVAEPALLLKFVSPEIEEGTARSILDSLPGTIAAGVDVRWVPAPDESASKPVETKALPLPDDAALRGIAGKVSEAARRMEQVEDPAAWVLLEEAEREARAYRFEEAIRPFLAEIFLRKGILKVREGDGAAAEPLLARSRALRPEFTPDPGIFPPQVLAAWERASRRPFPEADLLVESLPAGADVFVDGERRGKTPGRVRLGKPGPHRIRVVHPGYREAEREEQWLPGDTGRMEFILEGDRIARLGEIFARPGDGTGSGRILSEIADAAGAARVAVIVLEKGKDPGDLRLKLYARNPTGEAPARLGERKVSPGKRSAVSAGKWAADLLVSYEWPPLMRKKTEKPWYNKWWFWAAAVPVVAGIVAAIGGGGGGSSGGTSGTIAVNF